MSLADLRANPPKSRPEKSLTGVSLRGDLVARVQELSAELESLPEPKTVAKPRKLGQTEAEIVVVEEHPRYAAIKADLAEIVPLMEAEEGDLRFRANWTDGEWRNWADAHPARAEGESGHDRDLRYTHGSCNADDLIATLGEFAHAWNGEELAPGDWSAIFEASLSPGDKIEAARLVVSMYESRLDFRKWRSVLSDALSRSDDSDSPANSASPRSDSTDGSLASSSEASTETETA